MGCVIKICKEINEDNDTPKLSVGENNNNGDKEEYMANKEKPKRKPVIQYNEDPK
jgi:hypothetical protein